MEDMHVFGTVVCLSLRDYFHERLLSACAVLESSIRRIVLFPIVQSMATSLLGTGLAASSYLVAAVLINGLFSQYLSAGEYVCNLSLAHLLVALCLTVALSMAASAYAAFRVAKIELAEVIRDV